ncbi:MAG: hypothetical protein ACYC2K_01660 [Gemmatimonadales bacterium]
MRYLRIKNWDEFQHYKDRSPPWIKLHRTLLDDYEFSRLQDASKAHLMLIWLFASQNDGRIPEDAKFLQARLGLDKPPDMEALINQGFLIPEQDASTPLADRKQDASNVIALARSREERREEAEESNARFARFWAVYPKKAAKPKALKAWNRLCPSDGLASEILAAIESHKLSEQWVKDDGKFIPHPATWLNERRWEDGLVAEAKVKFDL